MPICKCECRQAITIATMLSREGTIVCLYANVDQAGRTDVCFPRWSGLLTARCVSGGFCAGGPVVLFVARAFDMYIKRFL